MYVQSDSDSSDDGRASQTDDEIINDVEYGRESSGNLHALLPELPPSLYSSGYYQNSTEPPTRSRSFPVDASGRSMCMSLPYPGGSSGGGGTPLHNIGSRDELHGSGGSSSCIHDNSPVRSYRKVKEPGSVFSS